MENKRLNSAADGSAEDLIRTIMHLGASEYHAITLYNKAEAEMENGLIDVENPDVLDAHIAKTSRFRDDIISFAELRRTAMLLLFQMYDGGDKDMWCQIKHLGTAYITAIEAYQSSEDLNLLQLATEINKKFTEALTAFLGGEITDCASCLGDFLKAKE